MHKHMRNLTGPLALVLAGAVGACGGKPEPEPPAPAEAPASSSYEVAPRPAESTTRETGDDAARRAELARARAVLQEAVYFEFDRADLTDAARQRLERKAEVLRQHSSVALEVGGHADERGSDEYNLALGNRRAASVKRFLVSKGVEDGRLAAVSYGEERPASHGSDEESWAANRRAEFGITSGGLGE